MDKSALPPPSSAAVKLNVIRVRLLLAIGRMGTSLASEPIGLFVSRLKVLVDETGRSVIKICGWRLAFKPVLSSAAAGKLPSLLKFRAEAKTNAPGIAPV